MFTQNSWCNVQLLCIPSLTAKYFILSKVDRHFHFQARLMFLFLTGISFFSSRIFFSFWNFLRIFFLFLNLCYLLIIYFLKYIVIRSRSWNRMLFLFQHEFVTVVINRICQYSSIYRISSYSFRGKYSFLDSEIQRSQYINVRKLFKGGNYSWAKTIWGNTVF